MRCSPTVFGLLLLLSVTALSGAPAARAAEPSDPYYDILNSASEATRTSGQMSSYNTSPAPAAPATPSFVPPAGCNCESLYPAQPSTCQLPPPAVDPYCRLFPQDAAIRVRGWLDGGILGNTSNPASHFNGPYNAVQMDNGQFNQAYLIMDRELAADNSLSLGGRVDLLYGSDYYLAQSNGFERNPNGTPKWNSSQYYGLAMPQAYLEAGNRKLSFKVGHFYTIVGYESVQSPNNFFYSHSYSYQFAGPFVQWGGLANWQISRGWRTEMGIVNGWNSLDGQQDKANFLGKIAYTGAETPWWTSFAVITGDEFTNPAGLANVGNGYANRTRYSWLFSVPLGERAEYVFHQWGGAQQRGEPGGGTAKWYGIDQYLYYRVNACWRLGTRAEWFRDEDGTRVGLNQPSNPNKAPLPGTYGSWTVGANWTPRNNVVLRPELRWDTYNGPAKPFDDGHKSYQLLLGFDAIVQF